MFKYCNSAFDDIFFYPLIFLYHTISSIPISICLCSSSRHPYWLNSAQQYNKSEVFPTKTISHFFLALVATIRFRERLCYRLWCAGVDADADAIWAQFMCSLYIQTAHLCLSVTQHFYSDIDIALSQSHCKHKNDEIE